MTKRLTRLAVLAAVASAFVLPAATASADPIYCHDFSTFIVCVP